MTPFALVVRWSGDPFVPQPNRLLDPLGPDYSEGRFSDSVPGAFFCVGLRSVSPHETVHCGFSVDRARMRLIVGDAKLYGQSARAPSVESGTQVSDLSAILSGYDRLGENVVSHLVGDFAFVIWDWGERRAFAARDHFGLRPLYFRSTDDGIAFASDPRQLFPLGSKRVGIDPDVVLDYIEGDYSTRGRTFFTDIRKVEAAHGLTATGGRTTQYRYWNPRPTLRSSTGEEYVEGWMDVLRTCIRDRLSSAYPVAGHLSGGLDTACMLALAHEAYETDGQGSLPPFLGLSATFPGLSCDETANIDAISGKLRLFELSRWDGRAQNVEDLESRPLLAAPGLRRGIGGGVAGDHRLAKTRGARALLHGFGGDEIFRVRGIFRDMVAAGRIVTFMRQVAERPRVTRRLHVFEGMRAVIPGNWLSGLNSLRRGRHHEPDWFGPDLTRAFRDRAEGRHSGEGSGRPELEGAFHSNLHAALWEVLTRPQMGTFVELAVLAARARGMEVRMPYLDVRLAEYVMSIPWTARLPHGDMRRLQREGARKILPIRVVDSPKVTFQASFDSQVQCALPLIRAILDDARWASARFVIQSAARGLAGRGGLPAIHMRRYLWKIASLEVWLRSFEDYFSQYEGQHG